jgi:hypothetical protein
MQILEFTCLVFLLSFFVHAFFSLSVQIPSPFGLSNSTAHFYTKALAEISIVLRPNAHPRKEAYCTRDRGKLFPSTTRTEDRSYSGIAARVTCLSGVTILVSGGLQVADGREIAGGQRCEELAIELAGPFIAERKDGGKERCL